MNRPWLRLVLLSMSTNFNMMKKIFLVSVTFLMILFSCKTETNTKGEKVEFGIHEVVQSNEIAIPIIDTLKSMGVNIESNPQKPILGYITKEDSLIFQLDLSEENFKLAKIISMIDEEQKYCAIAGIRPKSVMSMSFIKKTKANGNNVEIYFNLDGAKEWADFTKQNIGKSIAFTIDNQIYSMPLINGEIKHGIAMITGLKDEIHSKHISESLNISISN